MTPVEDLAGFLRAIGFAGLHSVCTKVEGGDGLRVAGFVEGPDELLALVAQLPSELHVWFGVHRLASRPASGRGGTLDVVEVAVLVADLDWLDLAAHKEADLPTEEEARARLVRLGPDLQPTAVVRTGFGLQCYWALSRTVDRSEGEALQARLDARLLELGLGNERSDLASILRVPGTWNVKVSGDHRLAVVERLDAGRSFGPEYLEKHLPPARRGAGSSSGTRHHGDGTGQVDPKVRALADHLIEHHGAHGERTLRGGDLYLTRPGKLAGAGQESAHVYLGAEGDAVATVFSSTWQAIGPRPAAPPRSWALGSDGQLHHPSELDDVVFNVPPAGVDPATGEVRQEGEAEGTQDRRSVAALLVELAADRWSMAQAEDGAAVAVPHRGPRLARPLRGRQGVRQALSTEYHGQTGRVPAASALTDAVTVLEGQAMAAERRRFPLRVADDDGAHLLDLGWPGGETVVVTAEGWSVSSDPPVVWRRTELTGALPDPRGVPGDLGTLRELLNVSDLDWLLVRGWLVAALLGRGPVPVLWLTAEQGSAKTTATRLLASVLDASPAQVRKPPRDPEQWVTAALGSWVVALDNLSKVPEWLSDSICRAVTGDGDVRRALYSDGDLAVFAFRRAVMANTIDAGALRGDLVDRLLLVELERIEEEGYIEDKVVARQWEQAHPVALAGLLDLASAVLRVLPDVRLDRPTRMADFARILGAVDQVTGEKGVEVYVAQRERVAEDVVDGDLVARAVWAFVGSLPTRRWKGRAGELLPILNRRDDVDRPWGEWPTSPQALSGRLRRAAPALRAIGLAVDFERATGGNRERLIALEQEVVR